MNSHFETKGIFRIVGYSLDLGTNMAVSQMEIAEFWNEIMGSEKIISLTKLAQEGITGLLGASIGYAENKEWKYLIAVATNDKLPEGMTEYTVPSADWLIFTGTGIMPDAVQEAQMEIFEKWLPASDYMYKDAVPNLEVYLTNKGKNLDFEIWLPVKEK